MTDLPGRILAAIEAAADCARRATPGPWAYRSDNYQVVALPEELSVASQRTYSKPLLDSDGQHIARSDPLITLRRCEADKRTVERHAPHGTFYNDCGGCGEDWPCPDLLDRADAYDIEAP